MWRLFVTAAYLSLSWQRPVFIMMSHIVVHEDRAVSRWGRVMNVKAQRDGGVVGN